MIINSNIKAGHFTGFTLVEVLLAMLVVLVSCLAVLSLQVSAMRGASTANNQTTAVFLAESEIERLKSLPIEDLAAEAQANANAPVVNILNKFGHDIGPNEPWLPFTRRVSYFPKVPTSLSNQVEVEVAWVDVFGDHKIFYTTVITSFSF